MPGRYRADKCTAEGLTFDSKLEREVYYRLRQFLPQEDILHHQSARYEPIAIAPPTKRFPKWEWKVDFIVPKWDWYVEAKGVFTDDWKLRIHALDCLNPKALDRLTVVTSESGQKVCNKLYSIDLQQLTAFVSIKSQR